MPKRIFIITGEPSGDFFGAELTKEILAIDPTIEVEATGGVQMKNAGAKIIRETAHLGAIGILNALLKIIPILNAFFYVLKYLRKNPPDLIILIDFGAFNVRMLQKLNKKIPSLYYLPPGSWSRDRKAGKLPSLVSAIATQFYWSKENLQKANANIDIEWVGHPLLDTAVPKRSREEIRQELNLTNEDEVIAIIPGSRAQELKYMLPLFTGAVVKLKRQPKVIISVAKNVNIDDIKRKIPSNIEVIKYIDGLDRDYLQVASAAFVTSGTATLEMALLNVPMVVSYRGSNVAGLQFLYHKCKFKKQKDGPDKLVISLPNIILNKNIVPEYVQYNATVENLTAEMEQLFNDDNTVKKQKDAFKELTALLGTPGSFKRTAEMAIKLLNNSKKL